jgi:putative PIN family toxin of toxin-antitoxin system
MDFDFEAVVCPKLIDEFRAGLASKYFQARFDPDDLVEIVASVEESATKYEDPREITPLLRDPDDDYLVALARDSGADAIVTGDRDLLDHPGLRPKALDARAACRLLGLLN